MKKQIVLLVTLIALNVADVVTTLVGFSLGAAELNPLFSVQMIPAKIAVAFLYAGLFFLAYKLSVKEGVSRGLQVLNVNLFVLVGIYVAVIANNMMVIAFI